MGGGGGGGFFENIGGVVEDRVGVDLGGTSQQDRAQQAQQRATDSANEWQRYYYEQNRKDSAPWRDAGVNALKDLGSGDYQRDFTMADYQADPGYAFRLQEGQKAIERSAAARGGLNSGATLKALERYSQGVASDEYNNAYNRFNADRDRRFNRLSNLAGLGQTANTQIGNQGFNLGQSIGQNQIGMGNAYAAGYVNQANRMNQYQDKQEENMQSFMKMGMMASDERLKTDIESPSKEDIAELRSVVKPYLFRYKKDLFKSKYLGVMAQDLEKTKLGKEILMELEGTKLIDIRKAISLVLAIVLTEGA